MDGAVTATGGDVFALTDEQIVGLETGPNGGCGEREAQDPLSQTEGGAPEAIDERFLASSTPLEMTGSHNRQTGEEGNREERGFGGQAKGVSYNGKDQAGEGGAQPGMAVPREETQAVPEWLAARMKDPWHGDEAKEFWDGKQRAEKEAAAYREVFATPEDARALKEIYPRGVAEAKSAAERARALDEIDAAFYRGDAAARVGLAQRMMAQDEAAFRAMVEAGVALLNEGRGNQISDISNRPEGERRTAIGDQERPREDRLRSFVAESAGQDDKALVGVQDARVVERSLGTGEQSTLAPGRDDNSSIPDEVVRAYGELERAANAELEKSVGAAIGRAMESALPNLKGTGLRGRADGGSKDPPLQARLAAAVREEVESALKSDRELGEQVTRVLAGRRFDDASCGQVVRLIDARAQQLVPGAVKRVVSAWTEATLAARGKSGNGTSTQSQQRQQEQSPSTALRVSRPAGQPPVKSSRERIVDELEGAPVRRGRRMDYSRLTDEEIVGM